MLRILFSLIGYVATATVITMALGLAYLWHTERLSDESMFRLIALLQGVDLEQIAATEKGSEGEVPAEEPSVDDVVGQQQTLDRNYEVKLLSLQRGRQEFDHRLQQLKSQTERFDRLANDWETKLKQQGELTTQENLAKVISDLEQVKPATAKDLLMRWIDEDRMDDVIMLLGRMSETKKGKILKSFSTPEELDKLHEIHRLMIDSGENQEELEQAQGELDTLKPTSE
jgi:3-methyladenine DNA glycosylase AlkC